MVIWVPGLLCGAEMQRLPQPLNLLDIVLESNQLWLLIPLKFQGNYDDPN